MGCARQVAYDVGMRKIGVFALGLLVLLGGCRAAKVTKVCAPILAANSVVVELPRDGNGSGQERTITDLAQIQRLADFANARRKVWQWKRGKTPAPDITAYFYENGAYLGGIGSGKNFLYASGPEWSGIRDAKPGEIREFKDLVGVR